MEILFVNCFPFDVKLFTFDESDESVKELCVLRSKTKIVFPCIEGKWIKVKSKLFDRDLCKPKKLKPTDKVIHIGDVVYKDKSIFPKTPGYSEITGFFITNKLSAPIIVSKDGIKLAYILPQDGKTYLGGSSATVFVNNNGDGFRLWDKISIVMDCGTQVYLYDILVSDIYIGEILVGGITRNNHKRSLISTTTKTSLKNCYYSNCDTSSFQDSFSYGTGRINPYSSIKYYY